MKNLYQAVLKYLALPVSVFIVKLFGLTYRFKELNGEGKSPLNNKKESFIYGFWHSQILPTIYYYRNTNIVSLASLHFDGELASLFANKFGIKTVRGSSTRGGTRALLQLKKYIENGNNIAITVDGPRGPRETVNNGIIYIAKLTGKKILPVGFYCNFNIRLKSWDKFLIPLPFSRGFFKFGNPIKIPSNLSKKDIFKYKSIIKKELDKLNEECKKELLKSEFKNL